MFTTYVVAWLPDILVEIPNGTRLSANGLSEVTRKSAVQCVTNRELPLGCIKATWYTAAGYKQTPYTSLYGSI